MKRRLMNSKISEILLYNIGTDCFESKKARITNDVNFKKFNEFSVYTNVDNLLYISGGRTKSGNISKEFFSFNSDTSELKRLSDMVKERCSHSLLYSNEIYAVGGYSNNTAERYYINTNKWEKLPDLNSKERQVPTLFQYNKHIICMFGYINNYIDAEDYFERLEISNPKQWEVIKLKSSLNRYDLKIYNVGIIQTENVVLLCGGEHYKGEETDNVYKVDIEKLSIFDSNMKLPIKCSFIDKNFVKYSNDNYGQYEMKKNNLVLFDRYKSEFYIKNFKY
jgi:N-acetylneuraminic acid mutarotase